MGGVKLSMLRLIHTDCDHIRIVSLVRNHTEDVADLRFEVGVESRVAQA